MPGDRLVRNSYASIAALNRKQLCYEGISYDEDISAGPSQALPWRDKALTGPVQALTGPAQARQGPPGPLGAVSDYTPLKLQHSNGGSLGRNSHLPDRAQKART